MRRDVMLVIVGGAAALLVAGWLLLTGRRSPPTPDEARRLVHEKNVALGLLENQALPEAISRLEILQAALPAEPLPTRNLAVARVLAATSAGQPVPPDLLDTALRALADMRRLEGESVAGLWLEWHLAAARGDQPAAERLCAAIIARTPDDAAAWYERSRAQRQPATLGAGDDAAAAQADVTLDRALALAPHNLWLVVEWLRATAARLGGHADAVEVADAGAAAAITAHWEAIAPFAPATAAFSRVDVRALLDESAAAVREGAAGRAAARLQTLANVLAPQTEADRRVLEHHPLEFVDDHFRARFYDTPGLAEAEPPREIAVTLVATGELGSVQVSNPPTVGGPRAVLLDDMDLDGHVDVLSLDDDRVTIRGRPRGSDTAAEWRTITAADVPAGATGLLAADLDLDFDEARRAAAAARPATDPAEGPPPPRLHGCPAADLDLVVWGRDGITCLENRADPAAGTRSLRPFSDCGLSAVGPVRTATVADLDADGQLDLVTVDDSGLRFWIRRGGGVFAAALDGGSRPPGDFGITALLAFDFDRDVDVDIVVAGERGAGWLENLRHGQFRWMPFPDATTATTMLDAIDANGDTSWDLLLGGPEGVWTLPTRRTATGVVRTGTTATIDAGGVRGLTTWDYDNDGFLDLATWGDAGLEVSRGRPDGRFVSAAMPVPAAPTGGPCGVHGFDAADLDRDGDLDCAVATDGGVLLLENRGGNANHWLDVGLEAQQIKGADFAPSGRVNAHGIGGLLELKAGLAYQPRFVRRPTTHFGLGPRPEADVVRVSWLNGVPQNIIRPPADLLVCEQQILLGSCPYVYAWNGREFGFVTDLLWAAPLGLQRAEGDLMPARDWEYLKIPGDALRPRDGEYVLQLTEELWEAAYFDLVQLIVVDHPADVEIESNEKVGPARIAAFKIHTLRRPRAPLAARDHRGRDVLSELAAVDGVFLRPDAVKRRQGLLEEHAVELDLGPLADPARVTLFLRGWTYPTTVGLNLALSRDARLGSPVPPSLAVPDGAGGWKTVLPFMGFPGGKTKTIAIDLSGLVPPDDPRVRIATSMEIAWDAAWITSGEDPAPLEVVELAPTSADLHFRGVSSIEHHTGAGPETFHYDDVTTAATWPPMLGRFTRYGEVTELLAERDDLLLVMGAGDEATLRFPTPPGPPPGWKRDFLLHSVGWDKDANLATAVGQSVDPLPFATMRSYPPGSDDEPPTTPARTAWLRDVHNRSQADDYWQAIRRRPAPPAR